MRYCDKCDTEYEAEESCICPKYLRWMETGYKNWVPAEWKIDNWSGYVNDPGHCNHVDFDEWMDGSTQCRDCGLKREGLA